MRYLKRRTLSGKTLETGDVGEVDGDRVERFRFNFETELQFVRHGSVRHFTEAFLKNVGYKTERQFHNNKSTTEPVDVPQLHNLHSSNTLR